MIKIVHRINTILALQEIPPEYGVEIDIRHDNRIGKLYLNHDPGTGDDLEEYLQKFCHAFIIFNIKEAGIEEACISLAEKYGIPKSNYFLLDVEHPYLYRAARAGVREIAIRYSEDEPIAQALLYKHTPRVDWVWIDTNTMLPLNSEIVHALEGFKTCLVSPDRWGRPEDIASYKKMMDNLHFTLDAVMVGKEYLDQW